MKLRVLVSFWSAELGYATTVGQEISCSTALAESLIEAKLAERIGDKEKVEEPKDESERSDAEPVVSAAKGKRGGAKRR